MEEILRERVALNKEAINRLAKQQSGLEGLLKAGAGPQDIMQSVMLTVYQSLWELRLETYILKQTLKVFDRKSRQEKPS